MKERRECRICGNDELAAILDLGVQAMTGIFPRNRQEAVCAEPLELVKCVEDKEGGHCGLVQLKHSYDPGVMYGQNYGYRSGLNKSMADHLKDKVKKILEIVPLSPGDMVIDIGSNDATLLKAYPENGLVLVGVDPTGAKFKKYYPAHIELIPDFFNAESIKNNFGGRKAMVITSMAMFYDLESPLDFMKQVHSILDDDGIWVFEQSYMPAMLDMNSYDTICHEHLEYYRLKQIKWMTDRTGFKIIDVEFNDINGGSFSITAAKSRSGYREKPGMIGNILKEERARGLDGLRPYADFKKRVFKHRDELRSLINMLKGKGKNIIGYGASTKGNVILQFCALTDKDISCIAEVNEDKIGCYTPGTYIPIIDEKEARAMNPDCFFVLPWHFKSGILAKEEAYLKAGGKLLFPLPQIEVVER